VGSIRILLAIAVVFAHSYGFVFVGGRLAVQLFYIISGFLISFILTEAKTYSSISAFYKNRLLRLFPAYFLVALGTLAMLYIATYFSISQGSFFSTYSAIDTNGKISLILSNIFIFGQDWIMFTGVKDGVFQFVSDFRNSEVLVHQGLIVPQAWTLGVELSFYLVAPFILLNKRLIITFFIISLAVRGILIYQGLGFQDPWTYRFFPAELSLFLLGTISHQFWLPFLKRKKWITEGKAKLITFVVFSYCLLYFLLPFRLVNTLLIIAIFTTSLPYMFEFQKKYSFDRWVGELSYPIYISHMAVIMPVFYLWKRLFGETIDNNSLPRAILVVIITIMVSVVINKLLERYINKIRNKIRKS